MCTGLLQLLHELQDLTWLRVSTERLLGEYATAVHFDLEDPAGGVDQLHLRPGKRLANLSRQTGGPRFVVSNDAVFNRHAHMTLR